MGDFSAFLWVRPKVGVESGSLCRASRSLHSRGAKHVRVASVMPIRGVGVAIAAFSLLILLFGLTLVGEHGALTLFLAMVGAVLFVGGGTLFERPPYD
jgi:hypothetical protein